MSTEDEMTIDERRKYLSKMQKRYRQASRKERGQLLDEMEAVTELHRKSLIRLMTGNLERRTRRQQRGRSYGPEVDDALRVIAESLDYICAERLTPNLNWMTEHLAAHEELQASSQLLAQLEQISVSTVGRILARIQQDERRLPRPKPKPANPLTRDIPMKRIPWHEQEPGHLEVDLVHHCGPTPAGEYVYTIQMVDVATAWSERVAILGRSYLVVQDGFCRILARLPFPVREVHPDNGTEFFNAHILRFWTDLRPTVQLSRSRPYQKNDNRFVEQKNATLVRAYLGYARFDTVAQTLALNQLYDQMWLYYNFFQPAMRLTEKVCFREEGHPTRVTRRYDLARTPFDRLRATTAISQEQRQLLEALRHRTNPRQLRREIYELLAHLFSLPGAVPGLPQDVRLTLGAASDRAEDNRLPPCPRQGEPSKAPERRGPGW
jgi:hypothetical protein